MPTHAHLDETTGGPWELVAQDCWRTPFSTVSWAYATPYAQQHSPDSSRPRSSFAKPPHYHHALYTHHLPTVSGNDQGTRCEDHGFNPDSIAVRLATETLTTYEMDVGFYRVPDDSGSGRPPQQNRFGQDINEARITQNMQGQMPSLTGDVFTQPQQTSSAQHPDPAEHQSHILPCSITNLIGSHSSNKAQTSLPNSPHAIALIKDVSSGTNLSNAADPLNASATSTSLPPAQSSHHLMSTSSLPSTPSPVFTDFTFPSLNPTICTPSPPHIPLEQAAHGSYQQTTPHPRRPFTTNCPVSHRSSPVTGAAAGGTSIGNSPSPAGSPSGSSAASQSADLDFFAPPTSEDDANSLSSRSSPSPSSTSCEDDGDGWIHAAPEMRGKARRTRELCLAMGRHQTRSPCAPKSPRCASPPIPATWPLVHDDGAEPSSEDGWIEVPPRLPQRPSPKPFLRQNRNHAPHCYPTQLSFAPAPAPHTPCPTTCPTIPFPHTAPSIPGPPFALPLGVPPYTHMHTPALPCAVNAAYLQMQTHVHARLQRQMQFQMQMQAHCNGYGHAEWFPTQPYPMASQPTLVLHAVPPVLPAMMAGHISPGAHYRGVPATPDPRNITGASGMRHAPWR